MSNLATQLSNIKAYLESEYAYRNELERLLNKTGQITPSIRQFITVYKRVKEDLEQCNKAKEELQTKLDECNNIKKELQTKLDECTAEKERLRSQGDERANELQKTIDAINNEMKTINTVTENISEQRSDEAIKSFDNELETLNQELVNLIGSEERQLPEQSPQQPQEQPSLGQSPQQPQEQPSDQSPQQNEGRPVRERQPVNRATVYSFNTGVESERR
jgi:predicted  nucleic acid-binding Zn-ribbon protein